MPEPDLVKTGIAGLDDILPNGIPRGNVILVEGSIGVGKTTMGVEFVYRFCGGTYVFSSCVAHFVGLKGWLGFVDKAARLGVFRPDLKVSCWSPNFLVGLGVNVFCEFGQVNRQSAFLPPESFRAATRALFLPVP
jgi:hypothetical protein